MGSNKLLSRIIGGVVLVVVMAGCSTTPSTLAPTVDFEKTIEVVKTQSVGTAIAKITPDVCLPTNTNVPTSTNTTQPTVAATLKPTNTLMPWWTKTATQASGGCTITESSPKANEVFAPNDSFDGKWVIKNKGDGKWMANEVDIRYASGTKFQSNLDVIDLNNDVDEEESYTVIVDMQAPSTAGTYVTTWVVNRGGQVICSMPLTIIVQ